MKTQWILFALALPHVLVSWLLAGLSIITLIAHKPRFEGYGVLSLELREWFATGRDNKGLSPYSTTLFRVIWWQPGGRDPKLPLDERLEQHEQVHIRQFEDAAAKGFTLGAVLALWMWATGLHLEAWHPAAVWLAVWLVFPAMMAVGWLTALLRHGLASPGPGRSWFRRMWEAGYLDSEHERSAYAQTDCRAGGKTWWDHREESR